MASHKYEVGQSVTFCSPTIKLVPTKRDVAAGTAIYEIVQRLPAIGKDLQYRIKGATDGRERMVIEQDLTALS